VGQCADAPGRSRSSPNTLQREPLLFMRWVPMRRVLTLLSLVCLLALPAVAGTTGRVVKVLPFFIDLQGRHALSPSLYDRDAYQDFLRRHPEQCSSMQFAVLCKGRASGTNMLKLRLEMRGSAQGKEAFEKKLEVAPVTKHWNTITLTSDDFKKLGVLTAWRATLWDGDAMVSKKESFLWTTPGFQPFLPPPSVTP
jgi:hypothetical protein